ncbi:MAG: hypothetical protein ACI8RZ_005804 [Myxococcota bacterium]
MVLKEPWGGCAVVTLVRATTAEMIGALAFADCDAFAVADEGIRGDRSVTQPE